MSGVPWAVAASISSRNFEISPRIRLRALSRLVLAIDLVALPPDLTLALRLPRGCSFITGASGGESDRGRSISRTVEVVLTSSVVSSPAEYAFGGRKAPWPPNPAKLVGAR